MTTTQFQNNETTDRLGYSWTPIAKPCDYCQSTAALLFCRTHSTFMCMSCDTNLHSQTDKHPRVWLCEVCEHSPAAVTCKADAASLCLTCDHDIHSANPLARRHERIAVVPFFNSAESVLMKFPAAAPIQEPPAGSNAIIPVPDIKVEDYVSDPWMLPDPGFGESKCPVDKSMEFLFNDSDKFFEFEDYGLSPDKPFTDCVVPVQATTKPPVFDYSSENAFELDFTGSKISYTTPSLNVSSSIDVGVVPDGSASVYSEISYTFAKDPFTIPNTDLTNGSQPGMDREARVLRYREKRKNRKFEKTVRYASRKAYAEIRPRIKGRFAKRTVNKIESVSDDIMFGFGSGNKFIDDEMFGVVPSFN